MSIAASGKKQGTALEGTVRIEYDNDRIVYTRDGVIVREDNAGATIFYNDAGQLIARNGRQLDGRVAMSNFDPISGKEIYRNGLLPDDTYGWVVAKAGESIQDAFA